MEVRSPKPGVRKNFETRNPKPPPARFGVWNPEFGVLSDFGHRISGLFPPKPRNFCLPLVFEFLEAHSIFENHEAIGKNRCLPCERAGVERRRARGRPYVIEQSLCADCRSQCFRPEPATAR